MTFFKRYFFFFVLLSLFSCSEKELSNIETYTYKKPSLNEIDSIIVQVNKRWQANHSCKSSSSWDNSVYQIGNLYSYYATNESQFLQYAITWANYNNWSGGGSDEKEKWNSLPHDSNNVFMGDNQVCFQAYWLVYQEKKDINMLARMHSVLEEQVKRNAYGYWDWADCLFMTMPTFAMMYNVTNDECYELKLYEYFMYTKSLLFDKECSLFYRDKSFIYPQYKSLLGTKVFWGRGNGWVIAALARTLQLLPKNCKHYDEYKDIFVKIAEKLKSCQSSIGYWTGDLLNPQLSPGPETSASALITYALIIGIRIGLLPKSEYLNTIENAWVYLSKIALQDDFCVGYTQGVGDKPLSSSIGKNSETNFGVGVYLMILAEFKELMLEEK